MVLSRLLRTPAAVRLCPLSLQHGTFDCLMQRSKLTYVLFLIWKDFAPGRW